MTIRARRVIQEVDEVIVPGRLSYELIYEIRPPRLVEFPMGNSEKVVNTLSKELSERCEKEDVAFACLGDPVFFSTFHHVADKVRELNPDVQVEIIPGIPSFTSVFSRLKIFVDKPFLVTTSRFDEVTHVVVLKATSPKKVMNILENQGITRGVIAEKLYMEGEQIREITSKDVPDKANYLSIMVGFR
jgi:precorrin-2/cobalt-factor-2 C20-methyltransferase